MRMSPGINLLLVAMLGLVWGMNWPIAKFAIVEYGPWAMRAVSLSGAALVLIVVSLLSGVGLRFPWRQWPRIAVPATVGIAAVNMLNAYAQTMMATGRTAIIAFSMPLWATLLALVFLGERLDGRKLLGLGLGAAGLAALAWPVLRDGVFSPGFALALISAACWATAIVFMKRWPVDAPPLTAATWQIALGAVCIIIGMLAAEGWTFAFAGVTPGFLGLLYNIVLAQAAGTWVWFGLLGRMPAAVAAIGTLMTPGVGVVGAMLLLGERPSVTDWLGLALVVGACGAVLIRPAAAVVATPKQHADDDSLCDASQVLAPPASAR